MKYTLKCKSCKIRKVISETNINEGVYICPVCHTKYNISINGNKELEYIHCNNINEKGGVYMNTSNSEENTYSISINIQQEIKQEDNYIFTCNNEEFMNQFSEILNKFFNIYDGKIIKTTK